MKHVARSALSAGMALLLNACAAPHMAGTAIPTASAPIAPIAPADAGKLPAYQRVEKLLGAIQLSGSSAVATFARTWSSGFSRIYPGTAVNVVSKSSGAAITDMAANPATIGMTSRPLTASERGSYAKQYGQPPLELKVAIDAVAIFVFKDNPLKSISIPQLERIFAATPNSGTAIDRWGQIGLEGEWAGRAVNGIGFDAGRGAYEIMRELVLRGGNFNSDISAEPVSTSVVQAVGVDPGAIGYASVYYQTARTRLLPIRSAGGELAEPTEADASSGKYPLARYLYLHLGAPKGTPSERMAREFLRYVLSEEGQNAARAAGAFAIPPALAHSQQAQIPR